MLSHIYIRRYAKHATILYVLYAFEEFSVARSSVRRRLGTWRTSSNTCRAVLGIEESRRWALGASSVASMASAWTRTHLTASLRA